MSKLHLWVGTLNDKSIIDALKKSESEMIYTGNYRDSSHRLMTDDEIKTEVLDTGRVKDCITYYYAKDLAKAKSMAREMGLKNFSKVCDELYEEGKDY